MNISEVHEGIIVNVMLQLMILKPPGGETAVHAMRCVDLLTWESRYDLQQATV